MRIHLFIPTNPINIGIAKSPINKININAM